MKEMNDWFKQLPVEPIKGACYPLGLWKNGAFFTESDDGRLLLYDPAIQEVRDLGCFFQGAAAPENSVHCYKESLIGVNGGDVLLDLFDIPWHILGVSQIDS